MVSARGSQGGRRGSPCPRIRALWKKVLRSGGKGDKMGNRVVVGEGPIPGLGGIRSPWGIVCQGWRSRNCDANWGCSPIAPRNGHLLGL